MPNYKAEVMCAGETTWAGNSLVFPSDVQAREYVDDLMMRWTAVKDTRVVETDAPTNYVYAEGKLVSIE